MINLCRRLPASDVGPRQESWRTCFPGSGDAGSGDAGPRSGEGVTLEEFRLPPGAALPRQRRPAELVIYLRQGALAYEESTGSSGVLQAGEFQRRTGGRDLLRREVNASHAHWSHLFQLCLPPASPWCSPNHETRRFSAAQRRGLLCTVAAGDGRHGALQLHHDLVLLSGLLEPGQHVVHQLEAGRRAWLHVVDGEVSLDDSLLSTGDGAGIEAERAVSLLARSESDVLLIDLA